MKEKPVRLYRSLIIAALAVLILFGFSTQAEAAVKPSVEAASISAAGKSKGLILVKGTLKKKVKSIDNYYYLFEVHPYTNKLVKVISSVKKRTSFTFNLSTRTDPAYANMKYALAVKTGSGKSASNYARISPAVYVKNPEKAAFFRQAYKYPKTKKGLQSANYSEQVDSGSKNAFMNLYVSMVTNGGYVPFKYGGTTYYFNDLGWLKSYVTSCNSKGILVTAQIMLDAGAPENMRAVKNGGEGLYAFNIKNRAARKKMDAMFAYLAKNFGTNQCYISNWILGNEVNSTSFYWYMGNSSESAFIENYATCFRSLYNAVRSFRSSSRVFVCLEHCWNMRNSETIAFPGKSVLQQFNAAIKQLQKSVKWNLAFHAYPADLRVPSFWNDRIPNSADALIISPKNLSALTSYIRNTYGSSTRIIISEIGFNHLGVSEDTQAAGLALAYDIAACDPMIDAFIIRSYWDEQGDIDCGVAFGIKGKKAFNVFKYMDTKSFLKKTNGILKQEVGTNWKSYVPGYKASSIYGMYTG